jgi:hypothetical protein
MSNIQRRAFIKGLGVLVLATPAMAQFGALKKLGGAGASSNSPALPMPPSSFIEYISVATNFGVEGAEKVLELYPPETIANIRKLCEQFNELQKQGKPSEIDQSCMKCASATGEETAKLDAALAIIDTQKTKALRAAHKKLTLLLLADAFASLNIKSYIDSLQNNIKSAAHDPMKASSVGSMKAQLETLTFVATAIPGQINSFSTVHGIVKKIAEAHKVTLADDPKPESLHTVAQLKDSGNTQDVS